MQTFEITDQFFFARNLQCNPYTHLAQLTHTHPTHLTHPTHPTTESLIYDFFEVGWVGCCLNLLWGFLETLFGSELGTRSRPVVVQNSNRGFAVRDPNFDRDKEIGYDDRDLD